MNADSAQRITLDGRLDQSNASAWLTDSKGWFDGQQPLIIDLADVERADSAGVALLLAWQRRAMSAGMELSIVNMPASICAITDVCGLASVLPVDDQADSGFMHHD